MVLTQFYLLLNAGLFLSLENIRIERSDVEDIIATLDVSKALGQDLISHKSSQKR